MPKIRQKGSVIVWVAASLIPLMGVLGVSIDAGRAYLAKERLQSALDGAGLAAARADAVSLVNDPALRWSQDVQPVMLNFFKLNFPIGFMGNGVDGYPQTIPQKVSDDGITMKFHASATIPTTFMRIMGVNQMTVIADTVVVRGRHKMEIVFAIDNTGSFGTSLNQQSNVQYNQPPEAASPMARLQEGMKNLVNTLFDTARLNGDIRIGIVPYAHTVNIRTEQIQPDSLAAYTMPTTFAASQPGRPPELDNKLPYLMRKCVNAADGAFCTGVVGRTATNSYQDQAVAMGIAAQGGVPAGQVLLNRDFAPVNWRGCIEDAAGSSTSLGDPVINSSNNALGVSGDTPPSPMRWFPFLYNSTFTRNVDTYTAMATTSGGNAVNTCARGSSSTGRRNDYVRANNTPCQTVSGSGNAQARQVPACVTDRYESVNYGGNYTGLYCMLVTYGTQYQPTQGFTATHSPNSGCLPGGMLPLSGNRAQVLRRIGALLPSNQIGTHADIGVLWATRVLSPRSEWKSFFGYNLINNGQYPAAWNDRETIKVVILIFDAGNDRGVYSTHGQLTDRRLNNAGSMAGGGLNTLQTRACNALKALSPDLNIYVVLQVNPDGGVNATDQAIAQGCATRPENYQQVSPGQGLTDALNNITRQLTDLRLGIN